MEVIMNKKLLFFFTAFMSLPALAYTKKIELLKNPYHKTQVVVFYDHHNDAQYEEKAQNQVDQIISYAQKRDALILIEDIFEYNGPHKVVYEGIDRHKYDKSVFLLRDVSDKARALGLAVENMDYRQEMEASINGKGIPARIAFNTVESLIEKIESFKDPELKSYYSDYLKQFKKLHTDIKQIFDEDEMVSAQLKKSKIGTQLLSLADKIPVLCQMPAHVIMLYDVRIMNLLFIHRIYELQQSALCPDYIFLVAGAFHASEVSNVLQTQLGYKRVASSIGHNNQIIDLPTFFKAHLKNTPKTVQHSSWEWATPLEFLKLIL